MYVPGHIGNNGSYATAYSAYRGNTGRDLYKLLYYHSPPWMHIGILQGDKRHYYGEKIAKDAYKL